MDKKIKVLYVYSGKGGVGKSTVCVNLAYSMHENGLKTAIFDADISGPSIPPMVKMLKEKEQTMDGFTIVPGIYGGVKITSFGFISEPVEGGFWSGKYLMGALYQLLFSVNWGDIDILLIDLPPGITNIHQELFLKLQGEILIITTPQAVSHNDVIRSIDFINRLHISVIGVVENMSYYICKECGTEERIFLGDTDKNLCNLCGLTLLEKLPICLEINKFTNTGESFILTNPNHQETKRYKKLAKKIYNKYGQINKRGSIVLC